MISTQLQIVDQQSRLFNAANVQPCLFSFHFDLEMGPFAIIFGLIGLLSARNKLRELKEKEAIFDTALAEFEQG